MPLVKVIEAPAECILLAVDGESESDLRTPGNVESHHVSEFEDFLRAHRHGMQAPGATPGGWREEFHKLRCDINGGGAAGRERDCESRGYGACMLATVGATIRELRVDTEFGRREQIMQDWNVAGDAHVDDLVREPAHAVLQLQIGGCLAAQVDTLCKSLPKSDGSLLHVANSMDGASKVE